MSGRSQEAGAFSGKSVKQCFQVVSQSPPAQLVVDSCTFYYRNQRKDLRGAYGVYPEHATGGEDPDLDQG